MRSLSLRNARARIIIGCSVLFGGLAAALVFLAPISANSGLTIAFGRSGLSSLKYRGVEYLGNGEFHINRILMRSVNGEKFDVDTNCVVRVKAQKRELQKLCTWGSIKVSYRTDGDQLNITVTATNRSPSTIEAFFFEPLALTFPTKVKEYDGNTPLLSATLGRPTAIPMTSGASVMLLVNEDASKPLMMGFPWALDKPKNRLFPLRINTGLDGMYPDSLPLVNRPIPPGTADRFQFSLRFAPPGTPVAELSKDLYHKFAATFPFGLNWEDRRPVGNVLLSSAAAVSQTNPRGWFDPKENATTREGLADLHSRLLTSLESSIAILRDMNAQGMITWDIEGQQVPKATTYTGDPRLVDKLAPEMGAMADEYFERFRNAGFRVGLCIRPQQFQPASGGALPSQQEVTDAAELLIDKIAYARRRWDATLFYVDSNGTPNSPMDPRVFKKVSEKFPDVLLIPQYQTLQYYAYTAPYVDLRSGAARTADDVRTVYPKAFSLINTIDGPIDEKFDDLVSGVGGGDILLFRCWYQDPANAKVKTVYVSAQAGLRTLRPVLAAASMPRLVAR
jgi:hypothetical protein